MNATRSILALFCATLAYNSARADFTYTETTQVTGGSLVSMMKMAGAFSKSARQLGQPTESTVIVKGNRLTRINPDFSEIIDLDKGTITRIDNIKHQYTVVTFEQMKRQMEEAMARSKAQAAKQPATQPSQPPSGTQVKFRVTVRNTGATKNVSGLDAKDTIMVMATDATDASQGQTSTQSGTLGFTSDLWLVPEIPGYKEVRDFYQRMAEKLGSTFAAGAGAGELTAMLRQLPPGATEGMADMAKEMSKIKGVPVLTVVRIGTSANGAPLAAASEAPLPPENTPSTGDMAKQGASSAIASSLPFGGFGLGRKKASSTPAPTADPNASTGSVVMMETTTQLASFSSAPVDASRFEVPAGYKQVEARDVR